MAGRLNDVPAEEADVKDWAQSYVAEQKRLMQSQRSAGLKPVKPNRAEVTRAVQARFGAQSGRSAGPLTWLRIVFWVLWILMML